MERTYRSAASFHRWPKECCAAVCALERTRMATWSRTKSLATAKPGGSRRRRIALWCRHIYQTTRCFSKSGRERRRNRVRRRKSWTAGRCAGFPSRPARNLHRSQCLRKPRKTSRLRRSWWKAGWFSPLPSLPKPGVISTNAGCVTLASSHGMKAAASRCGRRRSNTAVSHHRVPPC